MPELDLGGEVVVARRVAVPELTGQADQVGHGPLEAALGEVDHHVDPAQAGRGDQGLGQLEVTSAARPGLHDGRPEVDGDDRPLAGEVEGVEARLPALHPGAG